MKKLRILSLVLALLMLAPCMASCSEKNNGENNTASTPDQSNTPMAEETEPDILAGLDYKGVSFKMRTSDTDISSNNMIEGSGELNGDNVNDAVFDRNLAVSEALNIKLEYEQTANSWSDVLMATQNFIMAGDSSVSLLIDDQRGLSTASVEKLLYDTSALTYFDFNESCWHRDYMYNLSIDYKSIYLLVGDYFMNVLDRSQALLYNRDMYRDIYGDPDELYNVVNEGGWTYDKWIPLIEGAYSDINGDAKSDKDDIYGMIVGGIGGSIFPFVYGSDIPFVSRDENGNPTLTMYCDRLITLYDKIYSLFYSSGTNTKYQENGADLHAKFISGGALFISGTGLGDFGKFRDMESDIGIIPNPKLDEEQKMYRTIVWDTAEVGAIPVTAGDPEMAGAVIQMLCRQTHETVLPAYYETSLKVKYVRDNSAAQMINKIRDGVSDMFSLVYGGAYAGDIFTWTILGPLQKKETSISAEYSKREKAAVAGLASLIEAYNGN